jgi:GNAT superfamily N-acetyltransferase
MSDLHIRVATRADLPALAGSLGPERFFNDRLDRQCRGRGLLLMACLGDKPVGDVYLWLEPAEEPEIRQLLPGVPILQHLEVCEDRRNHRIGTALIDAAESVLRRRGHHRVALGVSLDNDGAIRLYLRRGYRQWDHPPIATTYQEFLSDGSVRSRPDTCQILVKDLVGSMCPGTWQSPATGGRSCERL